MTEKRIIVYQARVDAAVAAALWTALSFEERARAFRFAREADRLRFVCGRGWLRLLLAERLGIPARAVELAETPNGKPRLAGAEEGSGLSFNLAHAGDVVLLALGFGAEVGVDVEGPRALAAANVRRLADLVLAGGERAALERLPAGARAAALWRAWVRKEALLKGLGTGLSRAPTSVELPLDAPGPIACAVADEAGVLRHWVVHDLELRCGPPGYLAAVAVETDGTERACSPAPRLSCLEVPQQFPLVAEIRKAPAGERRLGLSQTGSAP